MRPPRRERSPQPSDRRPFPGVAGPLVAWFRKNRRDLPWRRPTESGLRRADASNATRPMRDPYRVWVSEIMLQQTTVKAVVPYFERFLEAFPTIETLARSRSENVLAAWSGLGYYRRARHLHEAARLVAGRHDGLLPRDRAALLELPGIGRYTAGAILSIAWGDPEPLVDGNVARVLCRLLGERRDPALPEVSDRLWRSAGELVAATKSPGDLNEALMELGATVCTPVSPACGACPLKRGCRAREAGAQDLIPPPRVRREAVFLRRRLAIVERGGRYLVRRRGKTGLMDGLWEFPELPPGGSRGSRGGNGGPALRATERLGSVRHLVTFRTIDVAVHRARLEGATPAGWRWVTRAGLRRLPTSSLVGKALALAV
ncbi:MAG TPA: A/G-specific adenine glycosylase [Candidatus Polarisedimenticolia bacterium]|nr:A/G-specific adenine glycosylase [Candidatus Polarisedimenticolia bacterium]